MALFDDYRLVSASGLFDAAFYLTTNPELAALSVDPLVHYLEEGARAGCNPHPEFDAVFYLEQCRRLGENPENPLLHFIRVGAARGLRPSPQANGTPAADALAKLGLSVSRHFIATIDRIAVSSGANGDGRKLSGEGWAVATEPIVELIVSLGELGSTVARYGLLRADVAQTFPQYRHADCSGFAFSLQAL